MKFAFGVWFGIVLGLGVALYVTIVADARMLDVKQELASVQVDRENAIRQTQELLDGGRFICRMEKDGNCTYRFVYKKGKPR